MENSKEFTKRVVQALFYQMTHGCNYIHCACEDCKSYSDFKHKDLKDANSIARLCISFAQNYKAHICGGLPPAFLKPELYDVSENFKNVMSKIIAAEDSKFDEKEAEDAMNAILSSPEQFEYLFVLNREPLSRENDKIDEEFVDKLGEAMYNHSEFFERFREKFEEFITDFLDIDDFTIHWLRAFVFMPAFRFYFDDASGQMSSLFSELISKIVKFPEDFQKLFFATLGKSERLSRGYIKMCQLGLTFYLYSADDGHIPLDDKEVYNIQRFMLTLRRENFNSFLPIKTSEFYNDPYSDMCLQRINDTLAVAVNKIFDAQAILSLDVKYDILSKIIASNQRQLEERELLDLVRQMGPFGQINPNDFQLSVEVRRDHLLDDALQQFLSIPPKALQRRLQIKFKGEDAVDVGGVSREFFYLITEQLFSPDHGMFQLFNNTYYWFLVGSVEETRFFQLLGTIIGLAIYNRLILPIRFPTALYKKLKGEKTTIEDLREINEDTYNSMIGLREAKKMGADVSDSFLYFVASYSQFGRVIEVPLVEGGENKEVTNDNLEEYIEAYLDWFFNKSVERMFSAFKRGFDKLCERDIFYMFTPEELETIVSGEDVFDWPALKSGTTYSDGYNENSRAIQWFWEIFNEFSEEQKKDFILFSTGTRKAPVGGLGKLNLVIQRSGDSDMLPVAHTCFNIFVLPDYEDKEKMKKSILTDLEYSETFGLK